SRRLRARRLRFLAERRGHGIAMRPRFPKPLSTLGQLRFPKRFPIASEKGGSPLWLRASGEPRTLSATMARMAEHPAVELHIVSDSTGETAARLVQALEAQFPDQEFEEIRHARVESVDDLELAVRSARGRP